MTRTTCRSDRPGEGNRADPSLVRAFRLRGASGNFYQVKIGGLVGTNELTTDTSNIQTAVEEFQHPDVEASEKATARALNRPGRSRRSAPSPRDVSVVVLNGNGKAGAAANTSYLLAQKGYRVSQPPEGFQANAPDAGAVRSARRSSTRARARRAGRPRRSRGSSTRPTCERSRVTTHCGSSPTAPCSPSSSARTSRAR